MDGAASQGFALVPGGFPKRKLGRDFFSVASDLLLAGDVWAVFVAGYISYVADNYFFRDGLLQREFFWRAYGPVCAVGAVLAPLMLRQQRLNTGSPAWMSTMLRAMFLQFSNWVAMLLVLGFLTRALDHLPRGWALSWITLSMLLILAIHLLFGQHLRVLEKRGVLRESIAIVGAGLVADRLIRHLRQIRPCGLEIVGVFDDRHADRAPRGATRPAGSIADLVEVGKQRQIDWILVTFPWEAESRLLGLVQQLKKLAVAIALCPQQIGLSLPYRTLDYVGNDVPVTVLVDRPLRNWGSVLKAAEDFVLAGLLVVALAPLLALIALAIKLDSPGPVLFRQRREGWNNRDFEILKFRTMRWQPQGSGYLQQTQRNDQRITRVGRVLRRLSLDELPQLFNVLRGDMSLVGPRPHAVNMKTEEQLGHEIIGAYAHRYRVKPGITGWAQVCGLRGATDTAQQLCKRVEYDLHYIENWSIIFDIKILFMTAFHVVFGKNAF